MGKRVTIYDIAREAGVSAATVSYVINNRAGQSISEETKNKIWHVINMLNYKPNVFAKNLRSAPDAKLIAVCTESSGSYLEKAEFASVLECLSASLRGNYDLILHMPPFGRITNADAIIAYNVTKSTFYDIGNKNYIPLVAVGCLVEDKLFFQVTADYAALKQKADAHFDGEYDFVCLAPPDAALKAQIEQAFDRVIFVSDGNDLRKLDCKRVLAVHGTVAEHFSAQNADVLHIDLYSPVCRQTADCISMALSREPFDIHAYKVEP